MPRPRPLLSVRGHLEHATLIIEGLTKYGLVPAVQREIEKFAYINKTILRKDDEKRVRGNRKDIGPI